MFDKAINLNAILKNELYIAKNDVELLEKDHSTQNLQFRNFKHKLKEIFTYYPTEVILDDTESKGKLFEINESALEIYTK